MKPNLPDASFAQRRSALARWGAGLMAPLLASAHTLVGAQPSQNISRAQLLAVWRQSGGVLLIRHAATESGLGDPPGFVIGQCRTQRNLNEAGRQASRALGAWLQAQNFKPDGVRSSQWCRCQDTARLAFGHYQDWPALNSTFRGQGQHEQQLQLLRERLRQLPAGQLEVWVTHQVIMTGLTGAYPAMGEGFLVDANGSLRAQGMMRPKA